MKVGTLHHMKTRRLARRLRTPIYQAVGILETLWHITAECAPAGDIGRFTDAEIAEELEWQGEPGELIAALTETGWLDRDGLSFHGDQCRLAVHDWHDHAPEFIKERLRKKEWRDRKRELKTCDDEQRDRRGTEPDAHGTGTGQSRDCPVPVPPLSQTCPVVVPSFPIHTNPIQSNPPPPPAREEVVAVEEAKSESSRDSPRSRAAAPAGAVTWTDVETRLIAAGVGKFVDAIETARAAGCSPTHIIALADHAAEKGFGPGAVFERCRAARPSLPVEQAWPPATAAQTAAGKRVDQAKARDRTVERAATLERQFGPELDGMPDENRRELAIRRFGGRDRRTTTLPFVNFEKFGWGPGQPETRMALLEQLAAEARQGVSRDAFDPKPAVGQLQHRKPGCQGLSGWRHVNGGLYCSACMPPTDQQAVARELQGAQA